MFVACCCKTLTFLFLFLNPEKESSLHFQELFEQMDPRGQPEDLQLAEIPQINTFRVNRCFGYSVHEYGFIIDPPVSGENIENQFYFDPLFANIYVFERLGAKPLIDAKQGLLYMPKNIGSFRIPEILSPFSHNGPAEKLTLTVYYKRELPVSEQVPFFNEFFKTLEFNLNFNLMSVYRAERKMDLINYWLSSTPGEIIEVSEGRIDQVRERRELVIKSDMSTRIANQDNIYELMRLFLACNDNFGDVAKSHFVGCIVKVIYDDNSPEYVIGDIDETKNPSSMFHSNGEELSFVDYFARAHNIQINDHLQPLFVNMEYVPEERKVYIIV